MWSLNVLLCYCIIDGRNANKNKTQNGFLFLFYPHPFIMQYPQINSNVLSLENKNHKCIHKEIKKNSGMPVA